MEELRHFNPYHDKLGRFTSKGGGAHRLSRKIKRARAVDSAFDKTIKIGKDKSPVSPAEKVTRDASSAIDSARKGTSAARSIKQRYSKKPKNDISKMSDQELRQKVNRMNLERQYNDLTSKDTEKGFDTAMDVLDVAGSVVGIAGGAAGIIATILMLKK